MNEIWVELHYFKDWKPDAVRYFISNRGRISSLRITKRAPRLRLIGRSVDRETGYRKGQLSGVLNGKRFNVHELVWWAFVGPVINGLVINHKDPARDRAGGLDNALENLELTTRSGNGLHAAAHGLLPTGSRLRQGIVIAFCCKVFVDRGRSEHIC